ncbi:gamma-glutamyltransferase [Haliangium ochraceum]|uniref:Gamma-glutamyltranspeptidase n=1 Tax=Haliangium ochraceum (strain DSM 14365 / JCM 11303 / SMP-2) TaxID=502025 RepID=D0LW70_HALO1|nr:gamma-glutamyltransferase [Haliangium ochraceum]ACY16002.1 gamma-glutamyltranspeptidase [Haliangium ochraceum DSM 14365]
MASPTRAAIAASSAPTRAAGERLAELGGNAVDIAVGAAITATVAELLSCSLAGSAMILVHRPGAAPACVDGACALPGLAHHGPLRPGDMRELRVDAGTSAGTSMDEPALALRVGHASVAVPGALAAFAECSQRFGALPWRELVAPARELARGGAPLTPHAARWLARAGSALFGVQDESRQSFFPSGDEPPAAGAPLRLPHLEDALDYIAREGARAFYQGDIAAILGEEMAARGALLSRADLAAYQAQVTAPLRVGVRGGALALPAWPSVAGAAAGFLVGLAEAAAELPEELRPRTAADAVLLRARAQAHWLAQLGPGSQAGRAPAGADAAPAWAARVRPLLDPAQLAELAQHLRAPSTTHISVTTEDGCAVSITASMGRGAGVSIPGTGIACNGDIGELTLDAEGGFRAPAGSRLATHLCPAIAWDARAGDAVALGSTGGSRAATAVAQTVCRQAFDDLSWEEAVAAPRLHLEATAHGARALYEPGLDPRALERAYECVPCERRQRFFGCVNLAARSGRGRLEAVSDPRLED